MSDDDIHPVVKVLLAPSMRKVNCSRSRLPEMYCHKCKTENRKFRIEVEKGAKED